MVCYTLMHLFKLIRFRPHDAMAELQIACLGEFQVTLAGTALTLFQTDKTRALLPYLALEARTHQRAELAQLLWPGYSDASARNSLRQALHQLRQTLADPAGVPWLLITRQTVQINPDAPIHVDVLTFRQLLATCASHVHVDPATCAPCLARLRQAVDLYHGDFLADFTVADSAPFEEWRRITQEQLHLQMLDALTQLGAAAEAAGDDTQALHAAHQLLTLEPWLEAAHRQVMRLLAQRGQRAAALAQYQRCRQVLAEALGGEPDPETTALAAAIHSGGFDQGRPQGAPWQGDEAPARLEHTRSMSQSPAHNLPIATTPFVGRTRSLAEIINLLQTTRLLTLIGPGGMGKTRLAVAVGQRLFNGQWPILNATPGVDRVDDPKSKIQTLKFPDGVWFVPLAAISTPAALVPAMASALGLTVQDGDPRSALLQSLRPQQLLLILDNFEHLLVEETAVDLVVDLLDMAPKVQILVTSRQRLNLRSEQIYLVPALSFAPHATLAEAAELAAVRLFVQAVQRAQPGFQLTSTTLPAVLRICQVVQAMPLGLELAAAQADALPLAELAGAIAQSTELLTVAWRDLPERQRSMRSVFAWSWRLLTTAEQRALRQISIFQGGFDHLAAQAVAGAPLPILTRLLHKSLLQRQETTTDTVRYVMHELLRQFAAEQLHHLPAEAASVAARHSLYYLDFVAARENRLARPEARQAADEIELEINNVRQAWRWAATNQATDGAKAMEALGHAAYSLWNFYGQRASRAEAEQMFRFALQQAAPILAEAADGPAIDQHRQALSKLLALHAQALVVQGKHSEAVTIARQAIALGQRYAEMKSEVMGSLALGMALLYLDQFAEARLLFEQTEQLARRYRSQFATSEEVVDAEIMAREYLVGMILEAGDYPGSRAYIRQNLHLSQSLGKRLGEQRCYYILARLAYLYGDYRAARQEYEQALALAQTLGDRMSEAYALIGLGGVLRLQGAYLPALAVLVQGLALARTLDDLYGQVWALVELTRLHCQLGHTTDADNWVTQLLQLMATRELLLESRDACLDVFALQAQAAGQAEQALAYAEQAWQHLTRDIGYGVALCFVTLGRARAGVQRWPAAAAAYQTALACYHKLNNRTLAVEAQAGLAQVALQQGDLAGAQAQVEALLATLAGEPRAGFNSPFPAYLTGYQVLAATGDPRCTPVAARL